MQYRLEVIQTMGVFSLFGLLFVIIGIVNIIYPQVGWYMKYGWQFRNAEPSDAALAMNRIGGVIAVIVGLFILFGGFPSP